MEYRVLENGQVLQRHEVNTGNQVVIEEVPYTMFRHVKLSAVGNIVTITHQDWQGNPLPFETTKIKIITETGEQAIDLNEPAYQIQGTGKITIQTLYPGAVNDEIEIVI